MADEPWTDLEHTGPGTLAGRYLRLFWQPVYRARDLAPGRSEPIRVMSEDFTLYRGEGGTPHVVDFRCAHRGTQLSVGWVEGDCIRCRYHGWMYDGSGQCVDQPVEDEPFPEKIRIRSYPCQEYLGLIFAYLGERDPPPIKRFPDFERAGYVEAGPREIWPANYMTRIDNDGRHVVYTHQESYRRMGGAMWRGRAGTLPEETEYGVRQGLIISHMPNINQVRTPRIEGTLEDAQSLEADRLFWRVPIDDDSCINYPVDFIPITGQRAEEYRRRREEAGEADPAELNALGDAIIAGKMRIEDLPSDMSIYKLFWIEDYVTQVGEGKRQLRPPEHLGPSDSQTVLRRQIWQRELRALQEGRPLKQWASTGGLSQVTADNMGIRARAAAVALGAV